MKRDEEEQSEKKSVGGMKDLARRVLLTGLGAVFMTEQGLRKGLGDLKLPKDTLGGVIDAVVKQKDDLLEMIAAEFSKFLSRVRVHEEIQKALTGLQLHIDAKLNFDSKSKPKVSTSKISLKKKYEGS